MGELGMGELEDDKVGAILAEVKKAGIAKRDVLSNEEFANIVASVKSA
jgi:methanogen homocitrate synthase